jgi:hypothetical protein
MRQRPGKKKLRARIVIELLLQNELPFDLSTQLDSLALLDTKTTSILIHPPLPALHHSLPLRFPPLIPVILIIKFLFDVDSF